VLTGRLERVDPADGPHIHHDNYPHLRAFIERQLCYALQDVYDPGRFDPDHYAAAALAAFARRHDPATDGDLSRALAVVMAWDQVMRGLIHWDQTDPKPSLENYLTLPVTVADRDVERENQELRAALADRERVIHALRNTRALRLCYALTRAWRALRGGR